MIKMFVDGPSHGGSTANVETETSSSRGSTWTSSPGSTRSLVSGIKGIALETVSSSRDIPSSDVDIPPSDVGIALETVSSRDIPSSDWVLDEHELTDDFAGTFVKGDNDEVLAHLTLVSGLCLRSSNLGPLGRRLLQDRESDFSHASVPEFGTLWSSMPLTAFLAKVSGKLLMLLLAISFTYVVSNVTTFPMLHDTDNNRRFVAAQFAVLDVIADPGDEAIAARKWQMTRFGPLFGSTFNDNFVLEKEMPFGHVDMLVDNYTILEPNHHISTYTTPLSWDAVYYALAGQHPTKTEYYAFVWDTAIMYKKMYEDEVNTTWTSESMTPSTHERKYKMEDLLRDPAFAEFQKPIRWFRNLTFGERASVGAGSMDVIVMNRTFCMQSSNCYFEEWHAFRAFRKIKRGWDQTEKVVIQREPRGFIGDYIWLCLAVSMWMVFVCLFFSIHRAKQFLIVVLFFHSLMSLIFVGLDLDIMSRSSRLDSFEAIALGVSNNMCCQGLKDLELDTRLGSETRTRLFQIVIAVDTFRVLQVLSMPVFAYSLWVERHILLNMSVYFGILLVYNCFLPPLAGAGISIGSALPCILGVCFPQYAWWRMRTILHKINMLCRADLEVWNACYQSILRHPDSFRQLQRIASLAAGPLRLEGHRKTVRQMEAREMHQRSSESTTAQAELVFEQRPRLNRLRNRFHMQSSSGSSEQESIYPEIRISPIRSIDQLYLQAITLAPFLSRLTQKWALHCGGIFRVKYNGARGSVTPVTPPNADLPVGDISSSSSAPAGTYLKRWSELKHEIEMGTSADEIVCATVKKTPRTLEKVQRCYKGDVSLLTDMCRATIAFETTKDLADCLEVMIKDPCISVDRIKNRLDESYDLTKTLGYRDVLVNFCIVRSPVDCQSDASWIKLGLSKHVCEVQLVPLEYFRGKTDFGHRRYILYRNLKSS
jgi:hypothetical protein